MDLPGLYFMLLNLENFREDYIQSQLDEDTVLVDPFKQFKSWMDQAIEANVFEPTAMTLATCTTEGRPAARTVLLKGVDEKGFLFFTNYHSRKGRELTDHPYAAILFFWKELQRQVRIEGRVEKITPEASTAYFQSRPKGSQIGAWASPQSEIIANREILEAEVKKLEKQYESAEALPRPEHWGGYRVVPDLIEFWQGRSSRLHDRLQYQLLGDDWVIKRLAP
ncbi:MAG: pyridoxine/pyridoxamine 5'-phosphate oxidase [Saprospiraceae bacterium]|nr:MAG: pyridoxine/pyridoxamine 5'-phosphate oxidase [Saprospiraceae bacterium]